MEGWDLAREGTVETAGVQISYGIGAAGLDRYKASDLKTYMYSPTQVLLHARGDGTIIPAHTVTAIEPGLEALILNVGSQHGLEQVFLRVPSGLPELSNAEMGLLDSSKGEYGITNDDWNDLMRKYYGGDVSVFTHESRFKVLPGGREVLTWFCNPRKGQNLSVSATEWTELRALEQMHYHTVLKELYVGVSGSSQIRVNDCDFHLREGVLLRVDPGEVHGLTSVQTGPNGLYQHVSCQTPPVPPDADKIVAR